MTPRTGALYASGERQFITSNNLPSMQNPAEIAKTYANVPVHMLATQMSNAQTGSGTALENSDTTKGSAVRENKMLQKANQLGSFVNMSQRPPNFGSSARPAQPTFALPPTNLGQIKAPPTINERPVDEESDAKGKEEEKTLQKQ